jgi:hypothetical protein
MRLAGTAEIYLNITGYYDKSTADIILNGEQMKAYLLKSEMRRVSSLPTLIQYSA